MPMNGSGSYVAPASTWNPAVSTTTINSTDWNALLADLTTALSTAMYKDGQQTPTANIKMGGFKLTGLAAATIAGDAVRYEQVFTTTTLTDQATIAWDASLAPVGAVTITANRTIGAPSNLKAGGLYGLIVTQNGTGGWSLTWNAVFKAQGGGTMPQPEPTAATITAFSFYSPDGTNLICLECLPFTDSNFLVRGSADTTKKLRFEIDGFTTATTRVLTPPDFDMQIGNGQIIAAGRNIAARTNSGTPNTKIDISADEICVRDANGTSKLLSAVSGTIDFGTVGANGLDASTQQASTWYYGWAIWNPATNTVALLGSASSSAPTLPSGYTFKALITAAFSDGSTHFIKYRQTGNWCFFESFRQVLTAGSASTETSITINTSVPPNALSFQAALYGTFNAGAGGTASSTVSLRPITGGDFLKTQFASIASGAGGFGTCGQIPNISQTLFYLFTPTTNVSSIGINVDVLGFKLPCGGE